jgi:hypothetical protein
MAVSQTDPSPLQSGTPSADISLWHGRAQRPLDFPVTAA